MFELLTGLAEVENRPASEIIDDILQLGGRNGPNGVEPSRARATEPGDR
jgi:hypothetical protein